MVPLIFKSYDILKTADQYVNLRRVKKFHNRNLTQNPTK